MVLGPLNIISAHLLSLLYSSFSELFPIWVTCALVIYWLLWLQRKHFHAKVLDSGRIFVARKDNYRYRTKMLQWGDSHSLVSWFLSVVRVTFSSPRSTMWRGRQRLLVLGQLGFHESHCLAARGYRTWSKMHLQFCFVWYSHGDSLGEGRSWEGHWWRGPGLRAVPDPCCCLQRKCVLRSLWSFGQLLGGPWYYKKGN